MTTIKESPRRVQRRRTKGWRMPENTVYVGRGTKWGNPWIVDPEKSTYPPQNQYRDTSAECVSLYRDWISYTTDEEFRTLAGKNLACWCLETEPCHADVLLEIANTTDDLTDGTPVLYWPGVRSENYEPNRATIISDGVVVFGGTACVRIHKDEGGTDYIQLSHIEVRR